MRVLACMCETIWAPSQENLNLLQANNKDADQSAHARSLICIFVIRYLESILVKLAPCKISVLLLVAVAEQAGLSLVLSLVLSQTPKTGFLTSRPIFTLIIRTS